MPELAAIYFLGLIFCGLLSLAFGFFIQARKRSRPFRTANENLKKAGLFWSESQDKVLPWSSEIENSDRHTGKRGILFAGLLLSLLSWPGAFFLLLIFLSYRFLAQSRLERLILASDLSKNDSMSLEQVQEMIRSLEIH